VWTRDGQEILFVSNKGHIHGTGGFWRMKGEPGAEAHEIHYEETNWKARPRFFAGWLAHGLQLVPCRQWHQLWLMPANGGNAFPHFPTGLGRNQRALVTRREATCVHFPIEVKNIELWVQTISGAEQAPNRGARAPFLGRR